MIDFRFLSGALEEATETANFYEREETGLGQNFFDALDATIGRIRRFPKIGKPRGTRLRSFSLRKFPIDVIYYIHDDSIVVVAVAHQSRRPGYWIDRISNKDDDQTQ